MNREALQSILQQPYQRERWLELFRSVLPGTEVFASPQFVSATKSHFDSIFQLGRARLYGERQLAVLEAIVARGIDLTRNRVGLRNLVARLIDQTEYHGVLVLFHSKDSQDYRFTFAARESVFDLDGNLTRRETTPRRYTYVLGPNETCRTAAERFVQLSAKAHGAQLSDVIDAFSVEKLNKEFFADFCRALKKVRDDISKWHPWDEETRKSEAQTLLNRLLFLYFVQRKGWLNRQRDYLVRNFRSGQHDNAAAATFHNRFLRPLFERLSTEDAPSLLPGHDLPFLNGGLFNDEYGTKQNDQLSRRRRELTVSNATYSYIFEHLLEPYNFTIHEDSPNNYEVAIDPEMLGRIFEALVLQGEDSDAGGKSMRHDTGSHYTPRPIVHYLCRNTLAAWLESQPPFADRKDGRKIIAQLLAMDATEGIDDEVREHLSECLVPEDAAGLRDRLMGLRSCDPAVGSGAFPMGLLHELINLIRLCEARARGKDPVEGNDWLYETKKSIIERVIYGVDIQQRAVEICKLRLWLSLMVDHELEVDPENCEVRAFRKALKALNPLPNLDFKIRRANSLVDYVHGEPINLNSPDPGNRTRPILEKLVAAKKSFYAARTTREKRQLRFVIYEATAELAQIEFAWARSAIGLIVNDSNAARVMELDLAQKETSSILARIKNARTANVDQQEKALARIHAWFEDSEKPTFVWQLDFAEVFHRSDNGGRSSDSDLDGSADKHVPSRPVRFGFDIMIGNPPYIRIQTLTKLDPEAVAYYKEHYATAKKGNYDIYVVFVERGLELLDEQHGQLGFILPHKFFNAQYGEPLRTLLSKGRHLRHVVHFGDQQIFPGATNYVCLLFLSTTSAEDCRFVRADDLNLWLAIQQGVEGNISSKQITPAEWNFAVGENAEFFRQLEQISPKLGDIADIFVGLQTSADDVYIMDFVSQTSETITLHSKLLDQQWTFEKTLLHPLVSGTDIRSFAPLPHRQFILFPYTIVGEEASLISMEELDADFPRTAEYLRKHKSRLESRERGRFKGDDWHRFGRSQNLGIQGRRKLCVPRLVEQLHAALDLEGTHFLDNVDVGGITLREEFSYLGLRYLLALINSSVSRWFFPKVSAPFRGGWYSANRQFLSKLPIPPSTDEQRAAIERPVDYLLWLRCQPSVADSDRKRPQDPSVASFFEQVINALVYELFFAEDLNAASLRFFDLVRETNLPTLDSFPTARPARLQAMFDMFQKLQAPGHPLRIALDKLQTLDLVRIIEGQK